MEIVTIAELPVEASMAGNNTCYVYCDSLNRRSNYGICLFTIRAFNQGSLTDLSDCHSHIQKRSCEALKLQKQEQEAGRALFYKAREIKTVTVKDDSEQTITSPLQKDNASYMKGWNAAGSSVKKSKLPSRPVMKSKPKPTPKPVSKKSAIFGTDVSDLSDAVNEAMKEESVKRKPKAVVRSGMTLLERARAMREAS